MRVCGTEQCGDYSPSLCVYLVMSIVSFSSCRPLLQLVVQCYWRFWQAQFVEKRCMFVSRPSRVACPSLPKSEPLIVECTQYKV